MTVVVKETFSHKNSDYEVRAWIGNDAINVQAFEKSTNKPANGYIYSVKLEDQRDSIAINSSLNPLSSLVETAKADVVSETWQSYLEALREIKAEAEKAEKAEKEKKQKSGE